MHTNAYTPPRRHLHMFSCSCTQIGGSREVSRTPKISQFIGTIWRRMTAAHSTGPRGHHRRLKDGPEIESDLSVSAFLRGSSQSNRPSLLSLCLYPPPPPLSIISQTVLYILYDASFLTFEMPLYILGVRLGPI